MALALCPGAGSGGRRNLTWGDETGRRSRGSAWSTIRRRRRRFQFCIGGSQSVRRLFLQLSDSRLAPARTPARRAFEGGRPMRSPTSVARACGDRRDGEIMAGSKLFSKLFQISRVFLQAFPKKALVVLWNFKGLQGFQTQRVPFQIFSSRPPPFGLAPNAVAPHSADSAVAIRVCSAVRRAAGLRGARSGLASI